jgi:HlyD family secretion protein
MSQQKRDEAKAAWQVAVAHENAMKSQYEMAKNGAREKQKEAQRHQVSAAKSAVNVVQAPFSRRRCRWQQSTAR